MRVEIVKYRNPRSKEANYARSWNREFRVDEYVHSADEDLDRLYELLIFLGYEMSDDEKAMRDGTHSIFTATFEEEAHEEDQAV